MTRICADIFSLQVGEYAGGAFAAEPGGTSRGVVEEAGPASRCTTTVLSLGAVEGRLALRGRIGGGETGSPVDGGAGAAAPGGKDASNLLFSAERCMTGGVRGRGSVVGLVTGLGNVAPAEFGLGTVEDRFLEWVGASCPIF